MQSLVEASALSRSIDLVASEVVMGGPGPTKDWGKFFKGIEGSCVY